jgi:catechol 1,2-dioxygenase
VSTSNFSSSFRGVALFAAVFVSLAAAATGAQSLSPTDPTHTGPWYEPGAPETANLWHPGDPGTPLLLHGRVLGTDGVPLAGALVELWHTDGAGSYPPLRASLRTKDDGSFQIRTVLRGHNRGYRARHIHFVVTHAGHYRLVTRIYFKGDPNMDEAPFPQLAILLEQANVDGELRLYASPQFVLRPY